jgi:SAM-dependent methyltransferase
VGSAIDLRLEHTLRVPRVASAPARAARRDEAKIDGLLPLLTDIADQYPEALRDEQRRDIHRIAFHIEQIYRPGIALADLGGGIGLFSLGCAALGLHTWLVDDFGDPVNRSFDVDALGLHKAFSVRVVKVDVRRFGERFEDGSLDVVTCFDSLEHWHHSPRPVFAEAFRVLKPGGTLLLSGPNAVNLRKRISVLFGRNNFSHFEDWFYPEEFRGHVREPVLGDLLRLVRELGFETRAACGRNWAAYGQSRAKLAAASAVDRLLRPFPTLCSDIYVVAMKPF